MNVIARFPEVLPGEFIAVITGLNMKVSSLTAIQVPANVRAQVRRLDVVTRSVTGLSNGAKVRLTEWDQNYPEHYVPSTGTTAFTGANNDLDFTEKNPDLPNRYGDGLAILFLDPGTPDAELSIDTANFPEITVNLATDGTGVVTTTAALLKAAFDAHPIVGQALITAFKSGNDGTGILETSSVTFSGGANKFEGVTVQTIADLTDLADTAAVNGFETVPLASGMIVSREGTFLRFNVNGVATATEQTCDILISGVVF
jgi:hypothetical protein